MNEILNRILKNGLEDFKGLSIQGTVPLREELVNELINQLVTEGTATSSTASAAPTPPSINPQQLLQHLDIQELRVSFEPGVAKLTVAIKR